MLVHVTSSSVSRQAVVHVVGRITHEVAAFLGPATHALAVAGYPQSVVHVDHHDCRANLEILHEAVERVPALRSRNLLRQCHALRNACWAAMSSRPFHSVHFHGFIPAALGTRVARAIHPGAHLFFSPHDSRVLGRLSTLALLMARPLLNASRSTAIVNLEAEARALGRWGSTDLVEPPVEDAFFRAERHEARLPLIVAGGLGQDMPNFELLAQLAVLMAGDEGLPTAIEWIGDADPPSQGRFRACGISLAPAGRPADRVERLASAWIGLAAGVSRGLPRFIAEAMAAGVPCVATDSERNRQLIRDGDTGYLCATEQGFLEKLALLIDDAALRARMGAAARAEARRRFAQAEFATRLLSSYEARTQDQPTNSFLVNG
jgi:glycosyltransferase involved in cell wall biosynthesis